MKKKILIIDDDEICRYLYRRNLGEVPGIEIVAEFESAEEALAQISSLDPDVIIADYVLPGISGAEFIKRVANRPKTKFLIASGHESDYLDSEIKNRPDVTIIKKDWTKDTIESIIGNLE